VGSLAWWTRIKINNLLRRQRKSKPDKGFSMSMSGLKITGAEILNESGYAVQADGDSLSVKIIHEG
jgi:hypothetical protein